MTAKKIFAGRQAVGMGVVSTMAFLYQSGQLTGNGPADKQMKEAWRSGGWKENHLYLGNVGFNYSSLEPFNVILSAIANIGDNIELMGSEWAEKRLQAVAFVVGRGITGKSYLSGLDQLKQIAQNTFIHQSYKAVMNLLAKNIRPRDIVTKKSLENAATIVAATGGSTNAALHLPAIANEIGIKFDLMDVAKIFKRTPYLADLKPGGKYVAKDMWKAGGVPMLLKTLMDGGYIHGNCMTVTGKTMKENLKNVKFNSKQKVMRKYNNPLSKDGGVVGMKGNLAPEGAIVKVAGLKRL